MIKKFVLNLISIYRCRYKNIQKFFVCKKNDNQIFKFNEDRKFFDIDNISDLKKVCAEYNFEVPDTDAQERFKRKSHFCVIVEDNHFGCWGWCAYDEKDFYVLEIDKHSAIPENVTVLYHYFTNDKFRRRGYYTELLQRIVEANAQKYCVIYAYDTNTASCGAIEKSGFKFIAALNHKTFNGFSDLIKKYHEER